MGQKVNPIGLRLGINRNWDSRWFPGKQTLATSIGEDYKIRTFLKKELYYAGVSQILIERTAKKLRVTVVAARPGIIIGKKGSDIEKLRLKLTKLIDKDVNVNIKEERRPQASAQLCAENVAMQLERRVAFRRAMKKVILIMLSFMRYIIEHHNTLKLDIRLITMLMEKKKIIIILKTKKIH